MRQHRTLIYRANFSPLAARAASPLSAVATTAVRGLSVRTRALSIVALTGLLAIPAAPAQQPQYNQGLARPGQNAPRDPAEASAYSAAISQPDPGARVSAIQQFLIKYPNSTLRQPAIAQMMLAKQAGQSAGAPAPNTMSRPMTPPPVAAANPAAPAPGASAPAPVTMPQPVGPPRDSLLQHAAKPAEVTVASHNLTIKADNSELSQILRDISGSTGMKVEGLSGDERIFGTYGPGDAREVLMSLLEGSGYNVLMVGDTNGVPRELSLTHRSTASSVASAPNSRNSREEEDDEVEQEVQQPPPQEQPQPAPNPNPGGAQPRNPMELQQEMLRLRQQQQQQQQQQPQQPPQ
jgi:hypothetical protein